MGTEINIFREEDLILNHMNQVGRLDRERELSRLINVLNDVLIEQSDFDPQEIELIYWEIKRELEREYHKTDLIDLDSSEMEIWHLSMFSSIEFLQKLLVNRGFDSPEEVVHKFSEILEDHFEEQLELFSKKHDVENLNERLPEPEVFLQNDLEVLYWHEMGNERREYTQDSKGSDWKTESKSSPHNIEVQI